MSGAAVGALVLLISVAVVPASAQPRTRRERTIRVRVEDDASRNESYELCYSISRDGRFLVFQSKAADLVPADTNGRIDVLVYDVRAGRTERASLDPEGHEVYRNCCRPSVSGNGRFVVLQSYTTALAREHSFGQNKIFLRDRAEGRTRMASMRIGQEERSASCTQASVSFDGSVVAYRYRRERFDPQDPFPVYEILVRDLQTGEIEKVGQSTNRAGTFDDGPILSADGRFVAYCAPDDAGRGGNAVRQVFVYDRETGLTEQSSVSSTGDEANGHCVTPSISADGQLVAFFSHATNLAGEHSGVFVHDRATGGTERVSVDWWKGRSLGASMSPSISGDGRFVALESLECVYTPDPARARHQIASVRHEIFVHDRTTGRTAIVSVGIRGEAADGRSKHPVISGDGRYIAFCSDASNLVPGDANGTRDIFIVPNPLFRRR